MPDFFSPEESDVVFDAFAHALKRVGIDMDIIDSEDVHLMRGAVIFFAFEIRKIAPTLKSDDVFCISSAAIRLYKKLRAERERSST